MSSSFSATFGQRPTVFSFTWCYGAGWQSLRNTSSVIVSACSWDIGWPTEIVKLLVTFVCPRSTPNACNRTPITATSSISRFNSRPSPASKSRYSWGMVAPTRLTASSSSMSPRRTSPNMCASLRRSSTVRCGEDSTLSTPSIKSNVPSSTRPIPPHLGQGPDKLFCSVSPVTLPDTAIPEGNAVPQLSQNAGISTPAKPHRANPPWRLGSNSKASSLRRVPQAQPRIKVRQLTITQWIPFRPVSTMPYVEVAILTGVTEHHTIGECLSTWWHAAPVMCLPAKSRKVSPAGCAPTVLPIRCRRNHRLGEGWCTWVNGDFDGGGHD